MRTQKLIPLVSAFSCLLPLACLAINDIEPGKEFYTVRYAPRPIVLDGDLSEWSGVPILADPKFAVPKFSGTNASPNYVLFEEYNGGTWTGPDDQTSAVQITYDANNVYFGFIVTDDYHENSANSAWNGDSVQLMIADATRTTQVALYNYALGGVEEDATLNDPANIIVNHEAGPQCIADATCLTEAVIKRDKVNHKTIYEIKLPMAALGLTSLKDGPQFGLGMAINDGDSGVGQNGQKGWGGLGAHSIVFGKTPSETALITLGTAGSGGDLLFLSSISPNFDSFTFRANDKGTSIVAPASAKLTIDGVVVPVFASPKVGDATDFTYTPPATFPPNSTHTYAIEVKDFLGNKVTASAPFTINNYTLDKLHSYYAQIRGSAVITTNMGGHTGQTGDTALDFGVPVGNPASALVPNAAFINPTASNDVMTVSVWIKKYDNTGGAGTDPGSSAFWIESPASPASRGFQANVPMADGTVNFDVGGNTPDDSEITAPISNFPGYTGDDSWWTNLWHHWAFVKNGLATKQIWIDGKLFHEEQNVLPLLTDFFVLQIGTFNGGSSTHGLIDDFAVWASALTPAEVDKLAKGTAPDQRVITATLATIRGIAAAANLQSPALFVVGDVVALHSTLAWFGASAAVDLSRTA